MRVVFVCCVPGGLEQSTNDLHCNMIPLSFLKPKMQYLLLCYNAILFFFQAFSVKLGIVNTASLLENSIVLKTMVHLMFRNNWLAE